MGFIGLIFILVQTAIIAADSKNDSNNYHL